MRHRYGVTTISRLLKITGLFCKRALPNRRYSAKETNTFKEPTNRSHPIGTQIEWMVLSACPSTHTFQVSCLMSAPLYDDLYYTPWGREWKWCVPTIRIHRQRRLHRLLVPSLTKYNIRDIRHLLSHTIYHVTRKVIYIYIYETS